jgi:hypothetical protein
LHGFLLKGLGKKKPPSLAVSWYLLGFSFCCYVNRPLLHRLGAGMAKVKVTGKENEAFHHRKIHV